MFLEGGPVDLVLVLGVFALGLFDGVEGDVVENVVDLGLVVFLLEDGDGVEGGFVIAGIVVLLVGLFPHLSVFVGFSLVFMLESLVYGIHELFLVERLHD